MRGLVRLLLAVTALGLPTRALAQSPISPDPSAAGVRIACFSPQRAFSESADGRAVIARLSTLQDQKARAIEERNKALQVQEQEFEQSAALLSDSARAQRVTELQKFRVDVQRFIEDARAEFLRVQRDAENAFVIKLKPALAKVAQDKGLQMVLNADEGLIAWFNPSLDITSDVVKQIALK
jgi:outer membrane protein